VKRAGPPGTRRVGDVLAAGTAIASVLKLRGISDAVRAERLVTEWTDLVGAKIASRTRPHGVYERVLVIEVATSAWMHELNLLKPRLLDGLVTRIGPPSLFDDLRFRLAGANRRAPTLVPQPRKPQPPKKPQGPPATGAAREQIVRDVEVVDDVELRELIARVRITNDR
jgi:predicted nucleic acid-binding Zn ribbon protein